MAYSETRQTRVIASNWDGGQSTTVNPSQTPRLVGVWDGGSESSTPQVLKGGTLTTVHVNWTSGTVAIELSPIGSNSFMPYFVDGSATIGADKVVSVFVPTDMLMRVTGATAVATVIIQKA